MRVFRSHAAPQRQSEYLIRQKASMEDKSNPNSNGNSSNNPKTAPAKGRPSRGTTRTRKSSKRRGLPQHRRVQLAYLLLSIIAVSLLLLLLLIPEPDTAEETDEAIRRTDRIEDRTEGREDPRETPPTDPREDSREDPWEDPREELLVQPLADIEPAPPGTGSLYLVIDDVGYDLDQLKTYLELPIPMTFALLPGLEHSQSAQAMIDDRGAEMILHQPIEPVGDQDPGPGALYVGMPPEELRNTINRNLDQLPKVIGVNNHMGSRGTADPQLMEAVFTVLKGRNLFFLDSRTTAETVAPTMAEKTGLPFSERHVFLDNVEEQVEIEKALKAALEISRRQGYAVMIGHVWSRELASTLALWYAEIEEQGYRFARLSSFFAEEHVHAGTGN